MASQERPTVSSPSMEGYSSPQSIFENPIASDAVPQDIAAQLHTELYPPTPEPQKTPLQNFLETRERPKAGEIVAELKVKTNFTELPHNIHLPHAVMEQFMRLRKRLPGGNVETYPDKLAREQNRGQKEAIAVGTAKVGHHDVVLATMHWDFYAGSVGSVVGEMMHRATKLAIRRRDPILEVISSAGIRQHENYLGLIQMRKINYALENFARKTGLPHIVALNGEVWGGIDASSVHKGDIITAFSGTNKGFTGPRLIEGFTGEAVPVGAQSAEMHALNRNVDVIVPSVDALITFTDGILTVAKHQQKKHKIEAAALAGLKPIKRLTQQERFRFDQPGFSNFSFDGPVVAGGEIFSAKERKDTSTETLDERLNALETNPQRPDTEFLLQTCFDGAIPLYNRFVLENKAEYPAIIAAIAYIGEQPFMVIGNQPSYKKYGENIVKLPASPKPADFDYMVRMLKLGEKLGLPAIFFTDTPGASPTLEAEVVGQSRAISQALDATDNYKYPVLSIITGELGSGGGLATSPISDKQAALSRALLFVAHPKSATEIIYNTSNATQEQISETLNSMGATAQQQKDMKLLDGIIEEPFGGAEADPHEMAKRIRAYIVEILTQYADVSPRKLRQMRDNKMANMHDGVLAV